MVNDNVDRNGLTPAEDFSFLNLENQKAIQSNPELINWRNELIEEQKSLGHTAGMFYSNFSTTESRSKYFSHLPHSIAGWSISALSPEDTLLQIQNRRGKLEESTIHQYFIIDPFRLPGIQLKDVNTLEVMREAIQGERVWLSSARGVTSGKVAIGGNDGRVRIFQGRTESIRGRGDKYLPQDRADIREYRDIFSVADSLGYGVENLGKDAETIGNAIKRFAGELQEIVLQSTDRTGFLSSIDGIAKKIQHALGDQQHVFAIQKMIIDYLTKLSGGPYDSARAIQCLRWLSFGHQDRLGKQASIEHLRVQTIALTHSHRLEWQPLYITDTKGHIDINATLAQTNNEESGLLRRAEKYTQSATSHTPQPFFGFREDWKQISQNTPKEDIKKLLLKQFFYILLSAIKSEYGYQSVNWSIPQYTKKRILELQSVWKMLYGNSLPDIRYDCQENFLGDIKNMIQSINNLST